jgi:hypothetical protein
MTVRHDSRDGTRNGLAILRASTVLPWDFSSYAAAARVVALITPPLPMAPKKTM